MNNTLWTDTAFSNKSKKLTKDLDLDILIIGGGITGLSIAYNLINSSKKVAVVEANKVGSGTTSKTMAKITYLQGNYAKIYQKYGLYTTKKYYESQLDAINLIVKTIKDNDIDCNLEKSTSYLYSNTKKDTLKLQKEYQILKKIGCNKISSFNSKSYDKDITFTIKASSTYTFHPLKYLYALKKIITKNKINIYENSRIISLTKKDKSYLCKTKNALIKTKQIIIASHYPFFIFPFLMPLKVTLEKSYISATRSKPFSYDALNINNSTSLRFYNENNVSYKLSLLNSHNISFKNNIFNNFSDLKNNVSNWNYLWSNSDIFTGDYMPFIGKIAPNMYLATAYNAWGMTNATLAGKIISNQVLDKENSYSFLFNPKRKIYSNYLKAISSSMKSFITEKIHPTKNWYHNKVYFTRKNNQDVAIYVDYTGNEHIVLRKCPHLKCNLLFNEQELTWDCPCHASRFSLDGNCIEGPSNSDIKFKAK